MPRSEDSNIFAELAKDAEKYLEEARRVAVPVPPDAPMIASFAEDGDSEEAAPGNVAKSKD